MATRSECPACGQMFTSVAAFDLHRTGSYARRTRRCLNAAEMRAKGLSLNTRGLWTAPQHDAPPWLAANQDTEQAS